MLDLKSKLNEHLQRLSACTLCPQMIGPVVTHTSVLSKIYLCGQAPGTYEGKFGKPFAWTAGKTLFRWLGQAGVSEEEFRARAYMGAVCRCFPGKNPKGGDRVPNQVEIDNCSAWMKEEFKLCRPQLLIPVGRLAMELFLPKQKLVEIVGKSFNKEVFGTTCDIIALPHPSGASTWFKVEPGATLLSEAIQLIREHPVWQETFQDLLSR